MPSITKPNIFLTSTIHIPPRGSNESELENVPIIKSGTLRPTPKAKRRMNPNNLLPNVDTMHNRHTKPGDKQGDATMPLSAPNANTEINDPTIYFVISWL